MLVYSLTDEQQRDPFQGQAERREARRATRLIHEAEVGVKWT